jgi:4-amino-4-deoxy-L-arabinose transferase-like glycosyltransferase
MRFFKSIHLEGVLFTSLIAILGYGITILTRQFPNDFSWSIRSLGLVSNILLFGGYGYYILINKGSFKLETLSKLILFGGLMIRLSYAYTTGPFLRQHDVAEIDITKTGHYGYILTILRTFALPSNNEYQFYHPPFYHLISAIWLFIIEGIFPQLNLPDLFDFLAVLSLMISYNTLRIVYSIIQELKLGLKETMIFLLLAAYHPILILFAGRHNNDPLSYFFVALIFLYFIRWWKTKQSKNLYWLGLFIALGIITKLSVAIITPVIGVLMLYLLWIAPRDRYKNLQKYLIFMLIVAPLGLSFVLRNYFLFDQNPTYVWEITNLGLSTADKMWHQRFLPFDFSSIFARLYPSAGDDYNIWVYLAKTSLFGEFSYWGGHIYAVILLTMNVLLVSLSVFLTITYPWFQFKKWNALDTLFMGYGALLILSYVVFNVSYPYGPTMDFRYLVSWIWIIAYLFIQHPIIKNYLQRMLNFLIIFSLFSVLFITFLF